MMKRRSERSAVINCQRECSDSHQDSDEAQENSIESHQDSDYDQESSTDSHEDSDQDQENLIESHEDSDYEQKEKTAKRSGGERKRSSVKMVESPKGKIKRSRVKYTDEENTWLLKQARDPAMREVREYISADGAVNKYRDWRLIRENWLKNEFNKEVSAQQLRMHYQTIAKPAKVNSFVFICFIEFSTVYFTI